MPRWEQVSRARSSRPELGASSFFVQELAARSRAGFRLLMHFGSILVPPGGHPAFERGVSCYTKNELAPSSDRLERAADTCFNRGMTVFHHTIDSGRPGGDPEALGPNVYLWIFFFTHPRIPGTHFVRLPMCYLCANHF